MRLHTLLITFSIDPIRFPGSNPLSDRWISKFSCTCSFFQPFSIRFFSMVKPKNQHRSAPYPFFNHKQMVKTDVFKHESFKSCSYTPVQQSKLVVVFIMIDLAGYFRQPHWKILPYHHFASVYPWRSLLRQLFISQGLAVTS